jgi:DNA-binding GntR family transcriptional regulator
MLLDNPIVPRSLVEEAFDRITDAIVLGEIEPGSRIREASLARQLGISRGVLREAMQRLEGLKLVSRTSNIGVRVMELSQQDLFELYTMREALEGMAARLAATNMTDKEIQALKALLEEHGQRQDLQRGDGYYQPSLDQDFHVAIARASRNERLERTLCNELYFQLRLYRYRSSSYPGRAQEAFAEHQAIVDALAARDPDAAEAAIRRHLRNARENLTWKAANSESKPKAASSPTGRARPLLSKTG